MWGLVLATIVHWTNPRFNAAPSVECRVDSSSALSDLAEIQFFGAMEGTTVIERIYTHGAVGREGLAETVDITLPHNPLALWSILAYAVDTRGNKSCPKWMVINGRLDVPSEGTPSPVVWYDALGRKYRQRPTVPGIYVEVQNKKARKIVLL